MSCGLALTVFSMKVTLPTTSTSSGAPERTIEPGAPMIWENTP